MWGIVGTYVGSKVPHCKKNMYARVYIETIM